jgi:hypothetical protein
MQQRIGRTLEDAARCIVTGTGVRSAIFDFVEKHVVLRKLQLYRHVGDMKVRSRFVGSFKLRVYWL